MWEKNVRSNRFFFGSLPHFEMVRKCDNLLYIGVWIGLFSIACSISCACPTVRPWYNNRPWIDLFPFCPLYFHLFSLLISQRTYDPSGLSRATSLCTFCPPHTFTLILFRKLRYSGKHAFNELKPIWWLYNFVIICKVLWVGRRFIQLKIWSVLVYAYRIVLMCLHNIKGNT